MPTRSKYYTPFELDWPIKTGAAVHSHDRTLLARLGFADPDKHDPTHDLASQYLAQQENATALILNILPIIKHNDHYNRISCSWEPREFLPKLVVPEQERPISKGEAQYKTTLGFIDLVLRITCQDCVARLEKERAATQGQKIKLTPDWCASICIEVKTTPVGAGEILRQLKLYREYVRADRWVLATTFGLTDPDLHALAGEDVHHVLLGERFFEWIKKPTSATPPPPSLKL